MIHLHPAPMAHPPVVFAEVPPRPQLHPPAALQEPPAPPSLPLLMPLPDVRPASLILSSRHSPHRPYPPGASQLSFKSPTTADATSSNLALQLWRERRLVSELLVPKAVHGALVNDGYFASGAAWSASEHLVAYTAEVRGRGRGRGGGGGGTDAQSCIPTSPARTPLGPAPASTNTHPRHNR